MIDLLKYMDVNLKTTEYIGNIDVGDTEIKYDWFDYIKSKVTDSRVYKILNQDRLIGYIVLYRFDPVAQCVNLYGKITGKRYFCDLLKAILSVMHYVFNDIKYHKVYFIYREDNYFFDDLCRFLHLIKEGIIREGVYDGENYINVNVCGILDYEYHHYYRQEYKRMFTWDSKYCPQDVVFPDISSLMNCRAFTNSLENPNRALINDSLYEFYMNRGDVAQNAVFYKDLYFPIKIFDENASCDSFLCMSQELRVSKDYYKDILLVAAAQFGYKEEQLILCYNDQSCICVDFSISDWCERILRDEYIIHYAYGCRELAGQTNIIKCDSFLFLKRISIPYDKKLEKIIFPNQHDILIFSVALVR